MSPPSAGNGSTATATATCPDGRAVLSGGGSVSGQLPGQGVALYENQPLAGGWQVQAIQTNAGADPTWNVRAFVVCGPPAVQGADRN